MTLWLAAWHIDSRRIEYRIVSTWRTRLLIKASIVKQILCQLLSVEQFSNLSKLVVTFPILVTVLLIEWIPYKCVGDVCCRRLFLSKCLSSLMFYFYLLPCFGHWVLDLPLQFFLRYFFFSPTFFLYPFYVVHRGDNNMGSGRCSHRPFLLIDGDLYEWR